MARETNLIELNIKNYTFNIVSGKSTVHMKCYDNSILFNSIDMEVLSSPFWNCQNFSIAYFGGIMSMYKNKQLTKEQVLDLVHAFRQRAYNKSLLVIDVNKC